MVTSALRGIFKENPASRAEILSLMHGEGDRMHDPIIPQGDQETAWPTATRESNSSGKMAEARPGQRAGAFLARPGLSRCRTVPAEAITSLDRALQINPNLSQAYQLLAAGTAQAWRRKRMQSHV